MSYYNILYKFYYKLFNLQVVKLELELFASKACKDLHVFSPLCEPQQLIKAQNWKPIKCKNAFFPGFTIHACSTVLDRQ